jgi:O-antigen/teichoic acid export membrane protein
MNNRKQNRQILINALMSVVQIVLISLILFVLYKFLLKNIGIDNLGIWSVVLSISSVAGITNFGLSGSVVKFVSKYLALNEEKTVSNVIQTAFITIALAGGIFLLIAYPVIIFVLKLILPSISFEKAISILPFAIISLWVVVITSIFQSGIDGYQRIDVRSFVMIGSSFFHLILSFVLVPHYGLMGLAYARTIQTITVLIISWVIIKRFIPALPFFPYKWDLKVFREIIRYGVNFQAISILQMLCEPTTKALLARFGDLAMVGYYEMASRMLMQFRSLLVSANQVLVPVIAKFQEQNSENIFKIYKLNYRLIFYLSVPYYSMIIAGTPLIS